MLKQSAPNWTERVPPAGTQPLPPRHRLSLRYLRRRWAASSHAPPTGWRNRFPAGLQAPATRILTSLGFGKDRLPRKRAEPELPTWPSLLELALLSRPGGPGEMTGLPAPPCRFPPPPLRNGHRTQQLPSAPAPSVPGLPVPASLMRILCVCPLRQYLMRLEPGPPRRQSFWALTALCPCLLQLGMARTTGPLIVLGWGGRGWTLGMKSSRVLGQRK